jgi:two-component system CheB/CheR fusion protein
MSPKASSNNKRHPTEKLAKKRKSPEPPPSRDDFLIAAIGASAGGMEAFGELMRNLPSDTGMAFILIQHLDPKHESMLAELVGKYTDMIVQQITDGMKISPNCVFVIPPNASMSIEDHVLHLTARGDTRGVHMSIDQFMRSLAHDQRNCAVGVVLSGTGSDGTLGLAEIQAQGGVTFAQDESTAKYDGMPHSAIAAGVVDYVLPPSDIAHELERISQHPYVSRDRHLGTSAVPPEENTGLNAIFHLLRRNAGVDFTHYRHTTILRRIQRRMMVHKIDRLRDYVRYLQSNPAEITALYQDMLIKVTSFFRNPSLFEALKSRVFPALLNNTSGQDRNIRIWTPGCASGEETYSVAIALLEYLGDKAHDTNMQLFGTDISESSVVKARAGLYPENIQTDVSSDRLRRFFTKSETGYRISKSIRDMCIFAQQNLVNDPPFSQMDLICCRNLLIYLEPVLQAKVISLFHYAIRANGSLVLGTSEGVGSASNLFANEDRTLKIFSKKATAPRQLVTFSLNRRADRSDPVPSNAPPKPSQVWNFAEAQKEFDRRLLNQFSPPVVFVDGDWDVVHTRGNASRYLKLSPGKASLNVLKMARQGLLFDLRNALNRAKKESTPVRRRRIQMRTGNGNGDGGRPGDVSHSDARESTAHVDFEVVPLNIGGLKDLYFVIVFQDSPEASSRPARSPKPDRHSESVQRELSRLQQELEATKEYLQSVIETHEATNEELQSANEEILSSNEELQSTNEELETAKEELQSTNEELITVNDELRNRNNEIHLINSDLSNVLASIDIAIVMVGGDLVIRRFTSRAQKMFGILPADIGRPLWNVNPLIQIPGLRDLTAEVISSFQPIENRVAGINGNFYQLRILPYRTADNKVDGAVITLVDASPNAPSH